MLFLTYKSNMNLLDCTDHNHTICFALVLIWLIIPWHMFTGAVRIILFRHHNQHRSLRRKPKKKKNHKKSTTQKWELECKSTGPSLMAKLLSSVTKKNNWKADKESHIKNIKGTFWTYLKATIADSYRPQPHEYKILSFDRHIKNLTCVL